MIAVILTVVVAYLNGVPSQDPFRMVGEQRFHTVAECTSYRHSVKGQLDYSAAMETLSKALPAEHMLTVTPSCEYVKGDK